MHIRAMVGDRGTSATCSVLELSFALPKYCMCVLQIIYIYIYIYIEREIDIDRGKDR